MTTAAATATSLDANTAKSATAVIVFSNANAIQLIPSPCDTLRKLWTGFLGQSLNQNQHFRKRMLIHILRAIGMAFIHEDLATFQ